MTDRDGRRLNHMNSRSGAAGSGAVLHRGAGAERYGERERIRRESERRQKFPNKRRKIITGRDLTTPLRGRAKVTGHKRVTVNVKIVKLPKEKLPWLLIFKLLAGGAALCFLVYSYVALFDIDSRINMTVSAIRAEQTAMQVLERQFQLENDPSEALRIAREEFGMVEEKFIQKHHIRSRRENRAVIIQGNGGFRDRIFSVIFRSNRE